MDKKGLTPIVYSSGPAAKVNESRKNVNDANVNDMEYRQSSLVPLYASTHAGEDVGVYAAGPFSYLFHSTIDNTFIAHAMKYAMCLRPYEKESHCLPKSAAPTLGYGLTPAVIGILVAYFRV